MAPAGICSQDGVNGPNSFLWRAGACGGGGGGIQRNTYILIDSIVKEVVYPKMVVQAVEREETEVF